MPSVLHSLVVLILRITRRRVALESRENFYAKLHKLRRHPTDEPSWLLHRRVHRVSNMPCRVFDVQPHQANPRNPVTVLYIHGGCHTYPAVSFHWDLMIALADRAGARVVGVLYPLSPEADCVQSMTFVRQVYDKLISDIQAKGENNHRVFIAGDSAGGGKTLTLAQQLAQDVTAGVGRVRKDSASWPGQGTSSGVQPRQADGIILISPWLDTSTSQPGAAETEKIDPMLAIPGAREAALCYAGKEADGQPRSLKDPRVSPLYGRLEGLPPVAMWAGTLDLLVHDARAFRDRRQAETGQANANTRQSLPSLSYHEEPGLMHVWPAVTFMPEARRAIQQMADFINKAA